MTTWRPMCESEAGKRGRPEQARLFKYQDGFASRRAVTEARIPCFTSLDTARAAVESMLGSGSEYSIKPLPAYRG